MRPRCPAMPYLHLSDPDTSLAYQASGESGSPVVLIMGLGFPATAWAPQLPALSAAHRVLTFDNRGVGQTRARPGFYRMELFADDVVALLDQLGWADAHLVGVSMGGMIAQATALRHRRRVRSLALICTHGGGFTASLSSPQALRWLLAAQLRGSDGRLAALQQILFSPSYRRATNRAELSRAMRPVLGRRPNLSSTLSQLHAVWRFRAHSRLPRLDGLPTLIVQGKKDILIHPKQSEKLQRSIPGSRLVCFPQGAHGLTLELAGPLNRLLLAHFANADRNYPPP